MQPSGAFQRRVLLKAGLGAVCGVGCASLNFGRVFAGEASADAPLIRQIQRGTIFDGRKTRKTWFQPRGCLVPDRGGDFFLMTLQGIAGSDLYGPVHWTISRDNGATWSEPAPIAGLGRRDLEKDWQEGVCDVTPEFHHRSNTVLAVGHNVYYHRNAAVNMRKMRAGRVTPWPGRSGRAGRSTSSARPMADGRRHGSSNGATPAADSSIPAIAASGRRSPTATCCWR